MNLVVSKAKQIRGEVQVPGDKSISHRAAIFGSLCKGTVEITNFLEADDCLSTINCLKALGVRIERDSKTVLVHGAGKYGYKASNKPLDVGNSGTTLRILPGLLAAQDFESTLFGDKSVSKRPMDRIVEPLSLMGADIKSEKGHAPVTIRGSKLLAISYQLPVPSAQVKSAILLAGLFAEGRTQISEKVKSRDHTERMLKYLGADIKISNLPCLPAGRKSQISNVNNLLAKPIEVPGDISSAAFFIAAALLLPGSGLTIKNIGLNPTRAGMIDILTQAGARISKTNERIANNEPVADLLISNIKSQMLNMKPLKIVEKDIPGLVDEIPILAVLATQIDGISVISGAAELRVKETDRLKAISTQLSLMGAQIDEKEDGLVIKGLTKLKGAVVDSGGDHRMAMSLAIAGLVAEGETVVKGAQSIDISFPGFAATLQSITNQ